MTSYDEWRAMWDRSGPFPIITHADAHLLLAEIDRLETERDRLQRVADDRRDYLNYLMTGEP